MHWRHIKWRAPWQKRHLSVLETFRAEEAAKQKAVAVQKRRDEVAHRATLDQLEKEKSTWSRCKRLIRHFRDELWWEAHVKHELVISGRETIEMVQEGNTTDEDRQELENVCGGWDGDYMDVLCEYETI